MDTWCWLQELIKELWVRYSSISSTFTERGANNYQFLPVDDWTVYGWVVSLEIRDPLDVRFCPMIIN